VGKNFCLTMLRLHAAKAAAGEPLAVVADQVGCPTATHTLAAACWRAIGMGADCPQILHWSDAGAASWYDFAVAIGELGLAAYTGGHSHHAIKLFGQGVCIRAADRNIGSRRLSDKARA
jgi:dTDP-4-dehydrorhamnose reductase